ncbi:MAG: DUF134 domain-containing protein [Candidatus Cloacimonetes bacterium]|nr:DUF134 domain-containing protein [Candidatus Cloacimonadota bacterium]
MPRPKKKRVVRFDPQVTYFKPRGVPLSELSEVELVHEELEALRLADFEGLDQAKAAKKLKVSQSTFFRILTAARKKTSEALVKGCAIRVKGGDYIMPTLRQGSGRGGLGRGLGGGRGRAPAGGGRGRMGGPFAAGPGGTCVCTSCGHEVPHQAGVPCYQQKCPKCGAAMVRKA